jgi:hypothetical protein
VQGIIKSIVSVGVFLPQDLEATNLKEGHLDSLLQSSFFIEADKELKVCGQQGAYRVNT